MAENDAMLNSYVSLLNDIDARSKQIVQINNNLFTSMSSVSSKVKEIVKDENKLEEITKAIAQNEYKYSSYKDKIAKVEQASSINQKELNESLELRLALEKTGLKNSELYFENETKINKFRENQLKINKQLDNLRKGESKQSLLDRKLISDKTKELEKQAKLAKESAEKATDQFGADSVEAKEATQKAASLGKASVVMKVLNVVQGISKTINKAFDQTYNDVKSNYLENASKINARLQGTEKSFKSISNTLDSQFAGTGVVKIKDMYSAIYEGINSGISYNLEERAFLSEVSENIASTFDAFSADLNRMILLQQSDSTAQRLGLESYLQTFLNSTFGDSSYLNNQFDGITSAILDASSQLSKEQSLEFEYEVQKWLGSMYSAGVSGEFVSQLAGALNLMGTGQAQALSGTQMGTLLAMAANKSGQDYGKLLQGGIGALETNTLLKTISDYLADIADNTDSNKVVAGAFGDIFSLSLADLRGFKNLKQLTNDVFGTTMSAGNMSSETGYQLGALSGGRIPTYALISNAIENLKWTTMSDIVTSPGKFATYEGANFVENAIGSLGVGGTKLGAIGNTIAALTKTALIGTGLINSFKAIANDGVKYLSAPDINNLMSGGLISIGNDGISLKDREGLSFDYAQVDATNDASYKNVAEGNQELQKFNRYIDQENSKNGQVTYDTTDLYKAGYVGTDSLKAQIVKISDSQVSVSEDVKAITEKLQALQILTTIFDEDKVINVNIKSASSSVPVEFSELGETNLRSLLTQLMTPINDMSTQMLDTFDEGTVKTTVDKSNITMAQAFGIPTGKKSRPYSNPVY